MTVDLAMARQLLDFGARMGEGARAEEQLQGAVAIHNVLQQRGVAYLADEVGMGKTYVTLGAIALFRHFNPAFRVLVLAPRKNIQMKWMKEQRNFVEHNVRYADFRNRSPDGRPAWPLAYCDKLIDLIHETALDGDRDFFCRLSSFSLAVAGNAQVDAKEVKRLRDSLRQHLPWIDDAIFDGRSRRKFKDNIARLLCCTLPKFDLVVVDEAHNLKHGYSDQVAARNRVLAIAMGREGPPPAEARWYPGYGPRAAKVLFLSATPVEDSYLQLWNQLDVFGRASVYDGLREKTVSEEAKAGIAQKFLIRRVTTLKVGDQELTRNLYRREWREGGVHKYDEPIEVKEDKQRLVLALMQKKVSELLGHERFNGAFQIGMLASFESFHETTSRIVQGAPEQGIFDDLDQTDNPLHREGPDVHSINAIAQSYRNKFKDELPHPKLDAVAASLEKAWTTGEKALVFVRRVASVRDLKGKLDRAYDTWLINRLKNEIPPALIPRLDEVVAQFHQQRRRSDPNQDAKQGQVDAEAGDERNTGGHDTFFAWFFRGEGPRGVLSGANAQERFLKESVVFEDNTTAYILQCAPSEVAATMMQRLALDEVELQSAIARHYTQGGDKRHDIFRAAHAAACELLRSIQGEHHARANAVWHERWEPDKSTKAFTGLAPALLPLLGEATFFDMLQARPALRQRLWPESTHGTEAARYRERFLRAQLLSSATRLGHGLIDVYVRIVQSIGTLEPGRVAAKGAEETSSSLTESLVELLEEQMARPLVDRNWGLFDELAEISAHFALITDVNVPDVRRAPLAEAARQFGTLLTRQQPVGGMAGAINQTLIRQFRMPGYPFVLVTTDLLQEGEDLHTFCSSVHHYGISWTPSSIEQRTGRIDRVRSKTDRRLAQLDTLHSRDKLQVHFPYLQGTVEVLQVRRVLDRMNTFLRLMHEGLSLPHVDARTVDVNRAMLDSQHIPQQIAEVLRTAFPVQPGLLKGKKTTLSVSDAYAVALQARFEDIAFMQFRRLTVTWESNARDGRLMGTAEVGPRIQPFTLLLGAVHGRPLIRCISPIGRVYPGEDTAALQLFSASRPIKLGAVLTGADRSYDLTVQGEVVLTDLPRFDCERVEGLIQRVVRQADELEHDALGTDEPMQTFRKDLALETVDGG